MVLILGTPKKGRILRTIRYGKYAYSRYGTTVLPYRNITVCDVGAVSGCTRKHAHFLPVLNPFLINSDTLSTLQYREPANRMPKGILCIRFAGSQYRSVLSVSELIKKGSNTGMKCACLRVQPETAPTSQTLCLSCTMPHCH